jgi:hypothetical protein
MPHWDDPRRAAPRREFERDRWRERDERLRRLREDDWVRRDAGAAGYREGEYRQERPLRADAPRLSDEPQAYGGQEYGMESPGPSDRDRSFDWGLDHGPSRNANFDRDDPGVGQSQAGYGGRPPPPRNAEFDADYLDWREEQLRGHDRDYAEWRRHQCAQYDEQYRRFRQERRETFGRTFHEWRSQRRTDEAAPDGEAQRGDPDETQRH